MKNFKAQKQSWTLDAPAVVIALAMFTCFVVPTLWKHFQKRLPFSRDDSAFVKKFDVQNAKYKSQDEYLSNPYGAWGRQGT